jgi:hypothetical protein
MVTFAAIVAALALAFYTGAHWSRESERKRFARGQIERFEAELLRSRTGRRPHPDPENAPMVSRIRFVRR